MEEKRFFYVAFLSTPYKMGEFIRKMTGFPYNHTAISLSPKMKYLYSFSRHYKNAPFYGGFTKESVLRYRKKDIFAKIKICAVPVSEENYQKAKKRLEFFANHSEEYIYNMISAACFPFKTRVKIKNSFTCVEFVLSMLEKYAEIPVLKNKKFCSIKELSALLEDYKIYEGSAEKFIENACWEGDTFPQEKGKWFYWKKTALNNGKLVYRFVKREK
ncbi:MAG: hypothetical protein J6C34_07830 [Oscillospiraceae bacterium]|nr:hypothetical protein [Oscillospiraceae bacterium]MBP1575507.1 hypothetical protein [Oscillospiraceae bacterium]